MPLNVPNLDDRRFDDLVAEARARIASHTPEWTQIVPGDPAAAFLDLFAWLTETILYRANLLPERQRRAFLNLLRIPLRPAQPARGVVCIDPLKPATKLLPTLPPGTPLLAGDVPFSTVGELQPLPLRLTVQIKRGLSRLEVEAAGIPWASVEQRQPNPAPFRPHRISFGDEPLRLLDGLDQSAYLSFTAMGKLAADELRNAIAGRTMALAIAPETGTPGDDPESAPQPRRLHWDVAFRDPTAAPDQPAEYRVRYHPLEVIADSSHGARRPGVVWLRLPQNPELLALDLPDDPERAGAGAAPPELPAGVDPASTVFSLRLRCPDDPATTIGYLGVNGAEIVAQAQRKHAYLGVGNGRPDQSFVLPDQMVDPDSLRLETESDVAGAWDAWQRVDVLHPEPRRQFVLDSEAGTVSFGDGLRGSRVPARKRVRASYAHGGGTRGNQPPGQIRTDDSRLVARQETSTASGMAAETVDQAERRIPAFLAHRNRAVTVEDFRALALDNPVAPVARADVVAGFVPGMQEAAVRRDVPGAVSVFVLPPTDRAARVRPTPTTGMLRDVFGYLAARVLVGTELYVLSPAFRPVAVSVRIRVVDPTAETTTRRAVEAALYEYLWALPPGGPQAEGWPLGRRIDGRELAARAARTPGVLAIDGIALFQLGADAVWRRATSDTIDLLDYELPEVMGLWTALGPGDPELPPGLAPPDDTGPLPVPIPVIPEAC